MRTLTAPRIRPGRTDLGLHASVAAATTGVSAALQWRLVAPHRAGWATAAAGAGGHSETFYLGAAGAGVWKSDDAGNTWSAVFDGVGSASVGALADRAIKPRT